MKWQTVKIRTDEGKKVDASAPVIISASRATDIPAFYAKWFINRLEKGYTTWTNPFNNKRSYISFQNTRVIVFWTKNPAPIIRFLPVIDKKGINYYFHYTLNDYETEKFEPHVPKLQSRIATFIELSEKIGKEKVIWRFDPLLLTPELTVKALSEKIRKLGNELIKHTNKLVFSFIDVKVYKKVQNNLIRELSFFNKKNVLNAEFTNTQKIEFAKYMQEIQKEWLKINPDFKMVTCAENIDLQAYNIKHNKCVDDELMIKLFKQDKKLMQFLGYENTLFGAGAKPKNLKDKGQRLACGCIYSKDIGAYNTCPHLCVYCYANTSKNAVLNNFRKFNDSSESILPI